MAYKGDHGFIPWVPEGKKMPVDHKIITGNEQENLERQRRRKSDRLRDDSCGLLVIPTQHPHSGHEGTFPVHQF